jgi:hypothetical protein
MATKLLTKQDDLYEADDASAESEEDLTGISTALMSKAVVWSTDWTAATVVDQLKRGTIALNPAFQRRDAWSNDRKSRFIESLILGLPIPQLVLAENNNAKGRFLVIDGKQRLLSLSKFTGVGLGEDQQPLVLSGLKIRDDLNKHTYAEIKNDAKYEGLVAEFENQPIRTIVVRGWKDEKVLYTIFHRLNTGSVPLSTQELRQALHPGPFLNFAESFSEQSKALKDLLELTKPDFRMRDVELVVRCFAFNTYLTDYRGNLKKFLDDTCDNLNKRWPVEEQKLRGIAAQMEEAIQAAVTIFTHDFVFKKWDGKKYEKSLNRAVFDVIASSLIDPKVRAAATKDKLKVRQAFKDVCINQEFRSAVESTTKSKTAVRNRFSLWFHALGSVIGKKIPLTLPPE